MAFYHKNLVSIIEYIVRFRASIPQLNSLFISIFKTLRWTRGACECSVKNHHYIIMSFCFDQITLIHHSSVSLGSFYTWYSNLKHRNYCFKMVYHSLINISASTEVLRYQGLRIALPDTRAFAPCRYRFIMEW